MLVVAALHTLVLNLKVFVKTGLFTASSQAPGFYPRGRRRCLALVILLSNRVIRRSFLGCCSLAFSV